MVGVLINSERNWCYRSNQVTRYLIGNWGYFEAVKQFLLVPQLNISLFHLSSVFISNTLTCNARWNLKKQQAKVKQYLEAELLLLRNYSLFSSTLSSKNNKRYSETCRSNKCVGFHMIIWLTTMKMRFKMKNRSHRYGINRPRPSHRHKYT